MSSRRAFAAVVLACLLAAGTASAQNAIPCPGKRYPISVSPILKLKPLQQDNAGADCALWQTFFYLNWPALTGARGEPDPNARFGAPGPTVWETYRRVEEVFLKDGARPQGWNGSFPHPELSPEAATEVDAGQARLLFRQTKISRRVIDVIEPLFAGDPLLLQYIRQADNLILYDQQKQPVYYDIAMNRTQFDYIVDFGLYNADSQQTFAGKTNIILPLGAVELKAAWKILTPAEAASGRFHTAKAYIYYPTLREATVGLVGLHVFTSGGDNTIGMWGTFAQIDNAPLDRGPIGKGPYNFYNPDCPLSVCPRNITTPFNLTQVTQVFADGAETVTINQNVQTMIKQYDSKSPWQYYKLINVLWSPRTFNLNTPVPIKVPLPKTDKFSTGQFVNPVLETFAQNTGTNCLSCHVYAPLAKDNTIAASYSFMFANAQAP